MKYITLEQFNKASEKVQYFILDWWIPSDGDLMYNLETKEREIFEPSYMDIDCVHSQCIPLLTVGQLIEFIERSTGCKMNIMHSYLNCGYNIFANDCSFIIKSDNLLQVLWEIASHIVDNKTYKEGE